MGDERAPMGDAGRAFSLDNAYLRSSQAARDPSSSCTLTRAVGASAQLQLNSTSLPDVRETEWAWDPDNRTQQLLVSWKPNGPRPEWYDLDREYKAKFKLTEKAFLVIENLTVQMSGRYTAKTKFKSGKSLEEAFRLCLYEPIPHPQIQVHSSSSTMGQCNVSLECAVPGTTGDLTVTWLSKDFPEEPEQRGVLESATSSRHLSLSLPWDQLDGHLTCVVSNPVDRKNVTLHLESVCLRRGSLQSKWPVWSWVLVLVVLMVSLGAGMWTWRKRRKMEAGRGRCRAGRAGGGAAAGVGMPCGKTGQCRPEKHPGKARARGC
ncbi:CD48 antigen-like [Pteropus alecto]|uniref:CD48 antigen-like n=1 Tax=Pteropus alecto TaxID=9402 RepID=UPI0007686D34|nr:CD48 antigen-like [Pteropus alecto]